MWITNLKVPLSILAVNVCWNSSSTASLQDLSINHVELYAAEVIYFQISKFHSYKCNKWKKQLFESGWAGAARQLHH